MDAVIRDELKRRMIDLIPKHDGPPQAMGCDGNMMAGQDGDIVDVDHIIDRAFHQFEVSLLKQMRDFNFDVGLVVDGVLGEKVDERLLLRLGMIDRWQLSE